MSPPGPPPRYSMEKGARKEIQKPRGSLAYPCRKGVSLHISILLVVATDQVFRNMGVPCTYLLYEREAKMIDPVTIEVA